MKLKRIRYQENINTPKQNAWKLEDTFLKNLSLIMGKNSTGKSKFHRLITGLTQLITNQTKFSNGEWDADFSNGDDIYKYCCSIKDGIIEEEKIVVNGKTKLVRNVSEAKLFSEIIKDFIIINPPKDKLVLHIRRDEKEYPFFENLYEWAENSVSYSFSSGLNPSSISLFMNTAKLPDLPSLQLISEYWDKLESEDINKIIDDLNFVGFNIEKISKNLLQSIVHAAFSPKVLFIKEKDVKYPIPQPEMSSGMYGVLSLLMAIQYLLKARIEKGTISIFIDDLGSDLDFERANRLAKLLKVKTETADIQIVATTNDQFLANAVSLDEIVILARHGDTVSSFSNENKPKIFEEFELTGLNNFDLFSSDFLK